MNYLDPPDLNRSIDIVSIRLILVLAVVFLVYTASHIESNSGDLKRSKDIPIVQEPRVQKKLIILSIDGFPGYYLESTNVMNELPNLRRFFQKSIGGRVKTVNPSATYPAHTSMITGVDPGIHGIEANRPVDPFDEEEGAWMWYSEDRKVKSLVEFAREKKLLTASIFWPVSVGRFTEWNIPQIWRAKSPGDTKLIRALSTPGFHEEMERKIGEPVLETTDDSVKIRTGIQVFKDKNPDLTLIYSTDVDTFHHRTGIYSDTSLYHLKKTDRLVGELIEKTNLYSRSDLGLMIVSDHGFLTATKVCRPNRHLVDMGYLRPKSKSWDFYFYTSAGIAALVGNPNTKRGRKRFPKLATLRRKVERSCPGVKFLSNGKLFRDRKKNSHPSAHAILYPNRSVYISATYSGAYFASDSGLNVHGYPNEYELMDTILYFYPGRSREEKTQARKINQPKSIKDSFALACDWLELKCRKGEKNRN